MTDIVIGTHNRVPLLGRTLAHILGRTSSPFRLHVIDDASEDETRQLVLGLRGAVASYHRYPERRGIIAHLAALLTLTASDPVVFTDDDVLCPDLSPDWLSRLLKIMDARPAVGVLALNNPQAHPLVRGDSRHITAREEDLVFCRNVGATFAAIRRNVLRSVRVPADHPSPMKALCIEAGRLGWSVGYLPGVYCQHLGIHSQRSADLDPVDMAEDLGRVAPTNPKTLEPPEEYRG